MLVQGLRLYSPPPVGGANKSARLMQSTLFWALELLSLGVQYSSKMSKIPLYWDFVPRRLTSIPQSTFSRKYSPTGGILFSSMVNVSWLV